MTDPAAETFAQKRARFERGEARLQVPVRLGEEGALRGLAQSLGIREAKGEKLNEPHTKALSARRRQHNAAVTAPATVWCCECARSER